MFTEHPTHGRNSQSFHPEGSTVRALGLLARFCDDMGIDDPVGWLDDITDDADGVREFSPAQNFSHAECDGDDIVRMYSKSNGARKFVLTIEIDTDADGTPDGWRDLSRVTKFAVEETD